MSDWLPFSHDSATGLTTEFAAQDDGATWGFRYRQDATPILDENKRQQTEGFDRRSDMWHAAHIPAVTIMEWINKHGVSIYDPNHKEAVRRLLNSSEYSHLRTNNFRL